MSARRPDGLQLCLRLAFKRDVWRRRGPPLSLPPPKTAQYSPRSESRVVPPLGVRHGNQSLAAKRVCGGGGEGVWGERGSGHSAGQDGLLTHCCNVARHIKPFHLCCRCFAGKTAANRFPDPLSLINSLLHGLNVSIKIFFKALTRNI